MTDDNSFNMLDRPCIPVTFTDGTAGELSITQAFEQARRIRSVEGEHPLRHFALTRLLLGIMYGTFPDVTVDQWKWLYDHGPEDANTINAIRNYLNDYHDRFDLFDQTNPFYQVADLSSGKDEWKPLSEILFQSEDTQRRRGADSMIAPEAFRALVLKQAYDWAGIKTGAAGDPFVKGRKGYAIGVGWCGNFAGVLVEGRDLWSTLMLNMIGPDVLQHGDVGVTWNDDRPIWEREQPTTVRTEGFSQNKVSDEGNTLFMHGPATLMTWQSRRIRLRHDGRNVTGVLVCNGDRLKPDNGYTHEPMTSWHPVTDAKTLRDRGLAFDKRPDMAVSERAIWKGLPALVCDDRKGKANSGFLRPYTLRWLDIIGKEDEPVTIGVYGAVYGRNNGVVETTVADRVDMRLSDAKGTDPARADMIRKAAKQADEGTKAAGVLAANISRALGGDSKLEKACKGSDYAKARREATILLENEFRAWIRHPSDDTDQAGRDWERRCARTLECLGTQMVAAAPIRAVIGRDLGDEGGWMSSQKAGSMYRAKLRKLYPEAYGTAYEQQRKAQNEHGSK